MNMSKKSINVEKCLKQWKFYFYILSIYVLS
jgi:hypothetical protein